ncbi:hypothetical protein D3C86_1537580 [compost metagenome]
MSVQIKMLKQVIQRLLIDRTRVQIRGLLEACNLTNDRLVTHDPACTESRRDGFGERARIDDVTTFCFTAKRVDRRIAFTLIKLDFSVRIIFQDEHISAAANIQQTLTAFQTPRTTRRVGERWNDVDHFRIMLRDFSCQILKNHTVIVAINGNDFRTFGLIHLNRCQISRTFNENNIAFINIYTCQKVNRLLGSCRQQHLVRGNQHVLRCHPLT